MVRERRRRIAATILATVGKHELLVVGQRIQPNLLHDIVASDTTTTK